MSVSFGEQDALAQNPDHPLLGSVWLGVVVWVLDRHLLERLIIGNGQTLGTKREKVADDRPVGLVPVALRNPDFFGDDGRELAPERESRDRGDLAEFGNIKRENVRDPDEPEGEGNGGGGGKRNGGNNIGNSGYKDCSNGRCQEKRHQRQLDSHGGQQ